MSATFQNSYLYYPLVGTQNPSRQATGALPCHLHSVPLSSGDIFRFALFVEIEGRGFSESKGSCFYNVRPQWRDVEPNESRTARSRDDRRGAPTVSVTSGPGPRRRQGQGQVRRSGPRSLAGTYAGAGMGRGQGLTDPTPRTGKG